LVSGRILTGDPKEPVINIDLNLGTATLKPAEEPGRQAKKILDALGKPKRGRVGKFPSGGRKIEGPSR
jgi:hypothetical protein